VNPGTTLGVGVVVPWYITIPLTPNFAYDPTSGNDLTIDIHLDGTGWSGQSFVADCVQNPGTGGQPLGCRVYNSTGISATTGSITTAHALVTEFTYAPIGLLPSFTATPRSGPLGQMVNFTDNTYTSDPGGITSWAWDVDGDSVTDYTTQHCSHSYTTEGQKSVTLTVTSSLFGAQSLTKSNHIVIDAVDASFSISTLPGTSTAVFTDTSAGNPTSWAWDFDNDGIVDSTLQNPVHTYPAGTRQSVCRLTVSDAFSNDTTTVNIGLGIIPVPAAGATFAAFLATPGFWFQSPTRFSIIAAKVPDPIIINATQSVAIFRMATAPPDLPATASGGLEFFAPNQPIASTIPCAVSYDVGEYVGVVGSCGPGLITSSLAPAAGPYSSSVLGVPTTLTRFRSLSNISTQGADHPYGQEPAAPISRVILEVTACAAIPYGTGSPSGLGPAAPKMRAVALPFLGQTVVHTVEQHDALVFQFMAGGFGRASFTLPPFGTILIGSLDLLAIMNGGTPAGPGTTPWSFPVPNLPSLVGATMNFQNVNLVLQSGAWSMSNGIEWVIGS
jgi:PKD repeat protein